jgi:hypothetical protein
VDIDAGAGDRLAGEEKEDEGEVAEQDDCEVDGGDGFHVTEEQRQQDRDLAIATSLATLTGLASLAGVGAGAAATAVGPIATAITTWAVVRLGQRRVKHAADTLMDAAKEADTPLGEFIDRAVSDDERHELFARTLRIAQDTARIDKRRALSRALAAGVMGDDARIDEELLLVRAIDDIDEMHIRLLGRIATGGRLTAGDIATADPGLETGVLALLGQLQSHGLIDSRSPVTPGGAMTPEPYYFITDSGRAFLNRLAEDPD